MKSQLYIYGGKNNKKLNFDSKYSNYYHYQLNSGYINGESSSLNDSKLFLSVSKEIRDSYTEYIYSLNEKFLKNKLIYNQSLSLFFLTEISNKRTEIFDTYQCLCHIIILREKLKNYRIDEIILDEVSQNFYQSIKSVFKKDYKIKTITLDSSKNSLFEYLFSQLYFFFKSTIAIAINKFFFRRINKITKKQNNSFFFTRYPKHFNKKQYDRKYNHFFDIKKDWYLISILADGFHQNVSIKEYFEYCKELKNKKFNFILLDRYLSFYDILKSIINSLSIYICIKKTMKQNFVFKNIDISGFLSDEAFISSKKIPRLLMYDSGIKKIINFNSIKTFYYYLFEFSYGRFFTYLFKKYSPSTKTCGFQHGPNSQRHIMFFLSKKEPSKSNSNFLKNLPIPDEILAENKLSKKVYEDGNYSNIKIMKKIYRLNYLKNVNRKNIIQNTFLVAAAMHDGSQLFNYLKDEMIKNIENKYFFKFHPRATKDKEELLKLNKPNIINGNDNLVNYLSFVSNVIVTQSSVGYEAFLLDIPVRIISLPNKINDSPLVDIKSNSKSKLINIDFS